MEPTSSIAASQQRTDLCVFGVPFWNPTYEEMKSWWEQALDGTARMKTLQLVNAHTLNIAWSDPEYKRVLQSADCCINDGSGYRLASKMRGVVTKYNFNGTDLLPRLFSEAHREVRVFFYGASEESNELAAKKLCDKYPNVVCAGRVNGFVDVETEAVPMIRDAAPDVLLVALGQPRQEQFLDQYRDLPVRVAVPCGGLFDFVSETKSRAPHIMRKTGTEWLYRLLIEPKRMFVRYVVGNPLFVLRALVSRGSDVRCAAESKEA